MPLWGTKVGDMKQGDYDKDGDGKVDLPVGEITRLLDAAKEEIRAEIAQTAPTSADAIIQAYRNARNK